TSRLLSAVRLPPANRSWGWSRHGALWTSSRSSTHRSAAPRSHCASLCRAEPFTRARIEALGRAVAANRTSDASAEIQQQNRDLLKSLEELRLRQEDLTRLNAELEDTNRGVMALYSELDERAAHSAITP